MSPNINPNSRATQANGNQSRPSKQPARSARRALPTKVNRPVRRDKPTVEKPRIRVQEWRVAKPTPGKKGPPADKCYELVTVEREDDGQNNKPVKIANVPFRFLSLPPELRNRVYDFSLEGGEQALLVHRPRMASLRSRTRFDRSRPLPSSVHQHSEDGRTGPLIPRDSNRPYFGLTQVCRQVRWEFRVLYLESQEMGIDLADIVDYLTTFYDVSPLVLDVTNRKLELPIKANLTIAVGDKIKDAEKGLYGVDVWPMLNVWANSVKVEAGFGRYIKNGYIPQYDGEAKDLYRLFGRRVLPDRSCTNMNQAWRNLLRTRAIAAVRVYRAPPFRTVPHGSDVGVGGQLHRPAPPATQVTLANARGPVMTIRTVSGNPRPYIHILFKPERAEAWMKSAESPIPTNWLMHHGFNHMEHFDIKVGILY